jgi:hypothetical protein
MKNIRSSAPVKIACCFTGLRGKELIVHYDIASLRMLPADKNYFSLILLFCRGESRVLRILNT